MKTFKVGDKVKIPLTKSFGESFVDFKILLKDYKLDYLVISNLERKNFMLKRDDGIYLKYNTFTPEDLEHYEEYNETFNPEAHSHLIIDFDKVETIEEIAQRHSDQNHIIGDFYKLGFIEGVKWCKEQLKN